MRGVTFALTGLIIFFFGLSSCNQNPLSKNARVSSDSVFTIHGKIAGLDSGNIIFVHRAGDDKVYDTVKVEGGKFELKGNVSEGLLAYVCFIQGREKERLDVMVENSEIEISAESDSFKTARISGSASQTDYDLFKEETKSIDERLQDIEKQLDAANDKATIDSLERRYEAYDSMKQAMVPGFVRSHPNSLASALIISRYLLIEPKPEVLTPLYDSLGAPVKSSKYGKAIGEVIEAARKTAIGQPAPDFALTDTNGKAFSLSSMKGKYVLVDFWASWCGPCRRENPNVVKVYKKFHSNKFDILGVSLDNKKDDWVAAIKKDGLAWNHVSDLKGWGNAASKMYGIRAIPANMLIDKEGKIIARNLMGDALENRLAEVLK